jgi:hypothetical protein
MSDANWLYHVTTKQIAKKIKTDGMTSALTRIGTAVANPKGSFAQNREKMERQKFEQRLKGYLIDILSRGCKEDIIKGVKGQFVQLNFVPQGNLAVDTQKLDNMDKQELEKYIKLLPKLGKPDPVKRRQFSKDSNVEQLAQSMLQADKNHFLSRLAVQYWAYRYKIEETITASHVYFLKPKYAEDGYGDYQKHLGGAEIVVLRVQRKDLKNLVDDDSDFRAEMTKETVEPGLIEVMVNHQNFKNMNYRCDAKNWQALTSWA